ncbi:hypothetical protein [Brachybacterium kimchii]|uniref:Uncharacterized protein n=1 Tax=Brachybacterium kimchii TaxID=2942909 RepID=A0ABY4N6Q0_9MICO|nr:hypothetical protein [Brachybacterium kimchii]UQN29467.1 hypothetical protein M4486_17810 [Brachybacterium kimchii]
MTTEPTDLRGRIAARIQPFLAMNYPCRCAPDDPTCDREWSEAEELADAVLPIVREAQAEAWGKGHSAGWHDHALDAPYAPLTFTPNPYKPTT